MASDRISEKRPWTFYLLAALFGLFLLFLYGPMFVIYVLSFQGPNGGVTFPMVGTSLEWFREVFQKGQMANLPVAFGRSLALASVVCCFTVVF
jgi:putative spermidine/putrescine transport system permease protein